MRDRLILARELLNPSGSVFVQISDENVHHVRELMDEVLGPENFVVTILLKKKGSQKGALLESINDYLIWFAKDKTLARDRYQQLYEQVQLDSETIATFRYVELPDGTELTVKELERREELEDGAYSQNPGRILTDFPGARFFTSENLTSGGFRKNQSIVYRYKGRNFDPGIERGNCWKHTAVSDGNSPSGLDRLAESKRLFVGEGQLRFKRYLTDFGHREVTNWWDGIGGAANPLYVVQTTTEIIRRCMLMTTRPGDLVIDPTCGSGTTAYVSEHWGRRWITIDASRVPLALARQRILTSVFPYYELQAESRGPAGGFVFKQRQNRLGEEVGGVVPHVTSSSIANAEPPAEEIFVDRPEIDRSYVRVAGPFCVEATIPTPIDWEGDGEEDSGINTTSHGDFIERMLEVLRRSPVLQLGGGKIVTLYGIRPPAKSLTISAEGMVDADANGRASLRGAIEAAHERSTKALSLSQKPVAIVFGPENGAVSEKLVHEAAREAHLKNYAHLYVIGFSIQANARELIESSADAMGVPSTYVQATPDLMMGDLLKTMRSSQIFSVCGMPEITVKRLPSQEKNEPGRYQVDLIGLDVFDPATMETQHRNGGDVPCWMLDTDYNGLVFHGSQVFFPRTAAWDGLKRALKATHEETVWDHLAGSTSAPFEAGEHAAIAVKVIDDRGNELLVTRSLKELK